MAAAGEVVVGDRERDQVEQPLLHRDRRERHRLAHDHARRGAEIAGQHQRRARRGQVGRGQPLGDVDVVAARLRQRAPRRRRSPRRRAARPCAAGAPASGSARGCRRRRRSGGAPSASAARMPSSIAAGVPNAKRRIRSGRRNAICAGEIEHQIEAVAPLRRRRQRERRLRPSLVLQVQDHRLRVLVLAAEQLGHRQRHHLGELDDRQHGRAAIRRRDRCGAAAPGPCPPAISRSARTDTAPPARTARRAADPRRDAARAARSPR